MYETLRRLLDRNYRSLQILADLEADLGHLHHSSETIQHAVHSLLDEGLLMADECNFLCDGRHPQLFDVILGITRAIRARTTEENRLAQPPIALSLSDDRALDKTVVGGKAAGIAALRRMQPEAVPAGFVLSTAAYHLLLEENELTERIRLLLKDLEVITDDSQFASRIETVRDWILHARLPDAVADALRDHAAEVGGHQEVRWAARSSAVLEDSQHSFAGLYETFLDLSASQLVSAYLRVVASRFRRRAILYRIHRGIREIDAPMAVLFMPMVAARVSGVIYTCDPQDRDADTMHLFAAPGLGDQVVRGLVEPVVFRLSREPRCRLLEIPSPDRDPSSASEKALGDPPPSSPDRDQILGLVPESVLVELGTMAYQARERIGHDLDIEWALGDDLRIRLLQARRVVLPPAPRHEKRTRREDFALVEGGMTIFPGRAEGEVYHVTPENRSQPPPPGSVIIVDQPQPSLAPLLPTAAALIATAGSPVSHLATLAREFSVPCIFQMSQAATRLRPGALVSVDATAHCVFQGARWAGMRDRVRARVAAGARVPRSGPLYDLVLALNLRDPDSSSFRAGACRSLHDTIRFMHEMSIRAMFGFGDDQRRGRRRKGRELTSSVPMNFYVVDLEHPDRSGSGEICPEEIDSVPFTAFWRGFADDRLPWPQRWDREMIGFSRDFQDAILGANRAPRRRGSANYVMVARDYLNFNARFTYHFTMVDAIIRPGSADNHVHFTFRSGGASLENRARRLHFIEIVLRNLLFEVDRRRDTLIAWLRRYSQEDTMALLERLGRLIVCSRELDVALRNDAWVGMYAQYFMDERYGFFS